MYRKVIFSVYLNRNALHSTLYFSFKSTTWKHTASGRLLRTVYDVQQRSIGTSGQTLCEKTEGIPGSSAQKEVKNDVEKLESTQPTDKQIKAEHDPSAKTEAKTAYSNQSKAATDDLDKAESDPVPGAEVQQKLEKKEETVRTGKEGLLKLLGAMKIDTTTKRKPKTLKKPQSEQQIQGRTQRTELESTSSMFQQAIPPHSETLNPELVAAAAAAASTLPDRARVESELLKQLRKHEHGVSSQRAKTDTQHLGNIIADMKVGKKPGGRLNGRPANQIRFDDDGRGYVHDRGITGELSGILRRKTAFSAKRLNIFSAATDQETEPELAAGPGLWDADFADQLIQMTNQSPRNGFEEMIQWSQEGKLWQYPINNEAGMEEEADVPFHEHVFLQHHLNDSFPQHGPVRHFMELVITGLSKNHHLTVQQKLEHIAWFRDYFHQKQEILKEAEA